MPVLNFQDALAQLPEHQRYDWAERAAIIEYDGKVPRAEAG